MLISNTATNSKGNTIFQVPLDSTIQLFDNFKDGKELEPTELICAENHKYVYYALSPSKYQYTISGEGYNSFTQNLFLTKERLDSGVLINLSPERCQNNGFESIAAYWYTDEFLKEKPDSPHLWPEYPEAFQTPFFSSNRSKHQHTTQDALEEYIEQCVEKTPFGKVFSLGTTHEGFNVPIVVFSKTDLKGANTLEDAAKILKTSGKSTIHYQAQVHGNEYASGEAALALVKRLSGDYGAKLLDKVNIYVIPRVSPDAAFNNQRRVPSSNIDPNRDMISLLSQESQRVQRAISLFDPIAVIDSHEYKIQMEKEEDLYIDMQVSPGFSSYNTTQFKDSSIRITKHVFERLEAQGLSYSFYKNCINGKPAPSLRSTFAHSGGLSFLLESRGTYSGTMLYGRRTVSHLIAVTEILDYIACNIADISAMIAFEKTVSSSFPAMSDLILLDNQEISCPKHNIDSKFYNLADGTAQPVELETTIFETH